MLAGTRKKRFKRPISGNNTTFFFRPINNNFYEVTVIEKKTFYRCKPKLALAQKFHVNVN